MDKSVIVNGSGPKTDSIGQVLGLFLPSSTISTPVPPISEENFHNTDTLRMLQDADCLFLCCETDGTATSLVRWISKLRDNCVKGQILILVPTEAQAEIVRIKPLLPARDSSFEFSRVKGHRVLCEPLRLATLLTMALKPEKCHPSYWRRLRMSSQWECACELERECDDNIRSQTGIKSIKASVALELAKKLLSDNIDWDVIFFDETSHRPQYPQDFKELMETLRKAVDNSEPDFETLWYAAKHILTSTRRNNTYAQ